MAVQLNCIYRADIRVSASLVSDGHRFFARLRSNRWEKRGRGGKEGGKLANFCFSSTFSLLVSSPRSSILYPLIQFVFPFSNVAKILPFFVKYRMLFRWNNFPLFLYSFLLLVKRVNWSLTTFARILKKKEKETSSFQFPSLWNPFLLVQRRSRCVQSANHTVAVWFSKTPSSTSPRHVVAACVRRRRRRWRRRGPLPQSCNICATYFYLHVSLPRRRRTRRKGKNRPRMDRSIIIIIGFRSNS